MLFIFFTAVFSSFSWMIYAVMFVKSKIAAEGLWEQSPEMMLSVIAIVFIPVLVIWMIFGYINQYINVRSMNRKQNELLTQLQKNQDYTDLVVRVMLDAEHEIKDGFVINKFDTLISDMNEALSEVIKRCNIASSAQLDQLWQRVGRGEKWSLGKAVLEATKSQSTFDAWVREKVGRDKVFRGALLEFCSRYQNLLQLLEKHDRDRIFLRMIETGVFGKVYSIIAPLTEGIKPFTATREDKLLSDTQNSNYASVLKMATIEEPKASESIVNVDKNDDEDEYMPREERSSLWAKLNPFKRQEEEDSDDENDVDPFFQALHNSFSDKRENTPEPPSMGLSPFGDLTAGREPSFESAAPQSETPTLSALRDEDQPRTPSFSNNDNLSASRFDAAEPDLPSQGGQPQQDNEDLVYPFGGWTDEDNYRK